MEKKFRRVKVDAQHFASINAHPRKSEYINRVTFLAESEHDDDDDDDDDAAHSFPSPVIRPLRCFNSADRPITSYHPFPVLLLLSSFRPSILTFSLFYSLSVIPFVYFFFVVCSSSSIEIAAFFLNSPIKVHDVFE